MIVTLSPQQPTCWFQNACCIFVLLLSMVICTGSVHMLILHLEPEMQNYFDISATLSQVFYSPATEEMLKMLNSLPEN